MPQLPEQAAQQGSVQYLNPAGLHNMPEYYTNVVVASGLVKTIYLSGLGAIDESGNIVGEGDIKAQAEFTLNAIGLALAAAGAGPEHIIKMTRIIWLKAKRWQRSSTPWRVSREVAPIPLPER